MATKRWTGNAAAVAQVTGYLFGGTWEATDIVNLTIGTKTVAVVTGSTVIATIIDTIVTAWAALSSTVYPEFAEITASRSTSTLVLTANTAGKPFTVTVSTTETGGGAADDQTIDAGTTSTGTDSTASSGPNHWDTIGNWDTNTLPVDGDAVVIENSSISILYGISQAGIDLASLTIPASYTGFIGLPDYNADGSPYYEYRTRYLTLGTATLVTIGRGGGAGSGRLKLTLGTNASTVTCEGTGSPASGELYSLIITGSHASNVLNATKGVIGLATESATTAQFPVIRVGNQGSASTDVVLTCGAGCTLGAITQTGGVVTVESNVTTWTKTGGSSTVLAAATIGTLTADGGTHFHRSSGTMTTATFRGQGTTLDCTQDLRGRTITNSTFTGGGNFQDPAKTITFANAFATDKISEPLLNLGEAPFSLQRS